MPRLTSLPREIRDQVLEFLLASYDTSPPTISHVRKWNTRIDSTDPTATKVLHSSLKVPQNALVDLSMASRQMYHEVDEMLRHNQSRSEDRAHAHLVLDLLLEDQTTYYTTWLRVCPYRGPNIRTMHVQMRTFTNVRFGRDAPLRHVVSASRNVDAAAYLATWRLGAVFNGLLSNGPSFIAADVVKKHVKPFIIQTLIIDIQPMEPAGAIDQFDLAEIAAKDTKSLLEFIKKQLVTMFAARSGVYQVPWGPLLLSRVRELVFTLHGSMIARFDVTAQADLFGISLLRF